jgi:hypothetical protein
VRKIWLTALALIFLAPAPALAGHGSTPGWIRTPSGCAAWNPHPVANESISWTGGCEDGKLSGRGVFIWYVNGVASDGRYEGEIREGMKHGQGIITWPNGNRYEGEFRNGKKHGRGIQTWANGNRHEGEYRDGKRHGRGNYTWPDGTRYEGEYRNGKQHGRENYTWANGDRYEGDWRNGKRHGRGIMIEVNEKGEKYIFKGEFRNDKIYSGISISPDNTTLEWRGGKPIQ